MATGRGDPERTHSIEHAEKYSTEREAHDNANAFRAKYPQRKYKPVPLTIFVCGPSECEHDYKGWQDIVEDGKVVGGTAVCTKCGATAFDEAAWL